MARPGRGFRPSAPCGRPFWSSILSVRRLVEVIGLLGELAHQGAGFLPPQPFQAAALLPFGEILLVDGGAAELVFEDVPDGGQAIEPFDQCSALLPVFDAAAGVVADGFWQAGDFSDASGAHIFRLTI